VGEREGGGERSRCRRERGDETKWERGGNKK
jgi:hypothetical protein